MTRAPAWRRYLRFWRPDVAEDVEDELRFHAEMRMREYLARGMSDGEARRLAMERLGDLDSARRECISLGEQRERETRRADFLGGVRADVAFALRSLRRTPGWTAVALLTIALGVGATTAVFSVADRLLVRTIRYPNSSRVFVFRRLYQVPRRQLSAPFSIAAVRAWREGARTIEGAEPFMESRWWMRTSADGADSVQVIAAQVDSGFLDFAGVHPLLGSDFTRTRRSAAAQSAMLGASASEPVMLSEGFWRREFGASPAVIGKVIVLGGKPGTIVGVVPASLALPDFRSGPPDVWAPYAADLVTAVAVRLRPRVGRDAAAQELSAILGRSITDPPWWRDVRMRVGLTRPEDLLDFRQGLAILTGAVALLLLVACVNVAHLLLARGAARERELAVRHAMGAGRWRLVRQLVTESLVLAIAGGALAAAVAALALRALQALRPESLMALSYVSPGPGMVVLAAVLAIAGGMAVGLAAAVRSARRDPAAALRANASGTHVAGRRMRGSLVVGEIALSATLLVGALLLVHALYDLERKRLGFDAEGMYSITFQLPNGVRRAARASFGRMLRERARTIRGAEQVTLGTNDFGLIATLASEGSAPEPSPHLVGMSDVAPDYFTVMRMPLLAGRTFDDGSSAQHEVIVSSSLAHGLWGNANPLGRRFHNVRQIDVAKDWMTVIGVVPDVVDNLLQSDAQPQIYQPVEGAPDAQELTLLVRMRHDADGSATALERFAKAVNPGTTPPTIESRLDEIERTAAEPRFITRLMAAFAALAVLLAAVGLFGVISYTVGQRTREIGVRMTLGATRASIARLVVGEGIRLAVLGTALGLTAAAGMTRVIASALYGVSRFDPVSFAGGAALLLAVAIAACVVPMLKATAVDPVTAVRAE